VIKDLNVAAFGAFANQAHISQLTDTVDQTVIPEPGFYGVLGVGLGAILMFAQRRKKAA
jgi:hypothetical protein